MLAYFKLSVVHSWVEFGSEFAEVFWFTVVLVSLMELAFTHWLR